ncbi:MAG: hypothetical protein ACOYMS_09755 [Terrimicrobiaceae bacterium]
MLFSICQTGATTITYQTGLTNTYASNYRGVTDTYLLASSPDLNYGAAYAMEFGPDDRAGLLRFNLTSFAGKYVRITGITLTLHISKIFGNSQGDLSAYAIKPANAGWVAGTGGAGVSNGEVQPGSSTWNRRIYDTASWAGSAGLSSAGTDYDATKLGSFHWTTATDYVINFSGTPAQLKALVDLWSGPQSSNAGILLRNVHTEGTGAASVLAANTTIPSWSPKLTITYSAGPAITVEQPSGTTLLNGSSTLDFGASSGTKTFTLRNDGATTLSSIALSVTDGNSGDFVVGAPGATSLAPGASTTFTVTFTPAGVSTRTTTLQITSNDTSASPFTVNLTGTGWTSLQAWRNNYFQTIDNSGDAADTADPDGDRLGNFLEFALGLDPKAFDAHGPLSLALSPEGVLTISFKRARPATEVTYTVRFSTDLSGWGDYAVNPGTVGQDAVLTDNVTTAPRRFFYLNVQTPP